MEQIVVPYDPEWPLLFEAERERLEAALGPWLKDGIHHVGSTSVPGIAAKPIIDMIAGVRDLQEARGAFEPLQALGYRYREHRPEAHCFWKPSADAPLRDTHHLHLTEPGSDIWRERLAFRDALRRDPALVAEYERLKVRLLSQHRPDAPTYVAPRKRELVARVLAEAGIDLRPDSKRLSATTLAQYRDLGLSTDAS